MINNQRLWPFHPKPRKGELFSSWLLRTALGNTSKPHTFCHLIWPGKQIWNRDIDILAGHDLLSIMAVKTATPAVSAANTLLSAYVGSVLQAVTPDRRMRWLMPIGIYHRTRRRYGLQWCPKCLANDKVQYFRKSWRMAFSTTCRRHQCLLVDACHTCHAPAVPHKGDHMACHICKTEYHEARAIPVTKASARFGWELVQQSEGDVTSLDRRTSVHPIIYFDIVRQLIRVLSSARRGPALRREVSKRFPLATELCLSSESAAVFEFLRIAQRHAILERIGYLFDSWPDHLVSCCKASRTWRSWLLFDMKPVRYALQEVADNHLNAIHLFHQPSSPFTQH